MQSSYSQKVIPVSLLNQQVSDVLEQSFPPLWVSGEISNLTKASSGHWYFVLKDSSAQVRCVMFRHKAQYVDWQVSNGEQVELFANIGFYAPRGEFQLNIETMRRAGRGALFEAFEALKAKLAAEGLFDPTRKQPIPTHPTAIGIVSSPQAAALRDILIALRRRAPHIPIIIYPAPVQGEGAAVKLAAAIETANQRQEVDVLIVGRGGGSIEDLWSFNEEVLARAIANSHIPIVSGVGHETDITIADFVADLRAPTPTAAAELVSPDGAAMKQKLAMVKDRLYRQMTRAIEQQMLKVDWLAKRLVHPGEKLNQQQKRLEGLSYRLTQTLLRQQEQRMAKFNHLSLRLSAKTPNCQPYQWQLQRLQERLIQSQQQSMIQLSQRITQNGHRLTALDPTAVLSRGYSLVTNQQGQIIRHPNEVGHGEALDVTLAGGKLHVTANTDNASPCQHELPL
ncbi:exodeoxyribonuclease VII large subunit [Leeia sp. TBRC 13508]|uniref:Exodeoxyribonuclease 7 large subunit n=1 Tax=Leeia speluncae TaxID=2884804 RepID=A0ABS8D7I7_9NEIS|nr:exodeoxyribonuclease VII large subunit [Leeia speluncae]MCB6184148.1 exodeoxyribonuclease VII large subunit [Leeia speluncae]